MNITPTNAAGERIAGSDSRTAETAVRKPFGRRLGRVQAAAEKADCSVRHFLRLCEAGKAPYGMKLGALRRWDLDELDAWIAAGCPPVKGARNDD